MSKTISTVTIVLLLPIFVSLIVVVVSVYALSPASGASNDPTSAQLYYQASAMISAGIAFGLSAIAAGLGISAAGSAAMSASAERPEVRSLGIIICGLAESIAIYGLIVALQLIGKI
jgi:V/A-type H+-transporting ATPase subunit K